MQTKVRPAGPSRPSTPGAARRPETATAPGTPGAPHRRRRRRRSRRSRRRRRIRIIVWSFIGAVVVFLGLSLIPAYLAGKALERGRDALEHGKADLLSLNAHSTAAESFAVAQSQFEEARRWADNPLIQLEGLIPIVGRTPDAMRHLARAGVRIAVAGSSLTEGVDALPDGLAGLAPKNGRIPIETVQAITPAVTRARQELEASAREIDPLTDAWVVPPVSDAVLLVKNELADALRQVRAADSIMRGLPTLAGVGQKRRYFVAAENPAELRGTGGIIGFYSIMTIEDGEIHFGPFHDQPPPNLPDGSIDGPPGFGPPYEGFRSPTLWLNANAVPDAPTSAQILERLWLKVKGQHLDGVIFITPQALQDLLAALGPVEIPKLDYTVTYSNVVRFTTNDAYFLFDNKQALRNKALGLVAETVLQRFFETNKQKLAVRALVDAASKGYIILHTPDEQVQRGYADAGVDGRFGPEPGQDFFSVIENNIARNKVDYYVRRTIAYDVTLGPERTATARAKVTFSNDAPSQKGFNEALGPYPEHKDFPNGLQLSSGEAYLFLTFYCGPGCRSTPGERGPDSVDRFAPIGLDGLQIFATSARLKSDQTRTFDLSPRTSGAWTGDDVGGVYRLRLQGQPTIKATQVRVTIALPQGMRMVSANVPVTLDDQGRLVWEGTLGRVQDIEITFERPLLEKLWTRVWDFLTHPVFKIG